MNTRVFFEVGTGELEQRGGGLRMVSLQMNKRAGQLDQTLVKRAVRTLFVLEPEMFQHLVRFVKLLAIETIKIAKIMRVQFPPVMIGNHFSDAFALATHGGKVKSQVQSLKPKVA